MVDVLSRILIGRLLSRYAIHELEIFTYRTSIITLFCCPNEPTVTSNLTSFRAYSHWQRHDLL